jgi:uncharacterized protein
MPRGAHVWRASATGLRLLARVTPKSARDGVDGLAETADGVALKVRVRAVAEQGKANAAVENVVAQWLGIAKSLVRVAQGSGKSRIKTIDISGAPGELEALITTRLAAPQ